MTLQGLTSRVKLFALQKPCSQQLMVHWFLIHRTTNLIPSRWSMMKTWILNSKWWRCLQNTRRRKAKWEYSKVVEVHTRQISIYSSLKMREEKPQKRRRKNNKLKSEEWLLYNIFRHCQERSVGHSVWPSVEQKNRSEFQTTFFKRFVEWGKSSTIQDMV